MCSIFNQDKTIFMMIILHSVKVIRCHNLFLKLAQVTAKSCQMSSVL